MLYNHIIADVEILARGLKKMHLKISFFNVKHLWVCRRTEMLGLHPGPWVFQQDNVPQTIQKAQKWAVLSKDL